MKLLIAALGFFAIVVLFLVIYIIIKLIKKPRKKIQIKRFNCLDGHVVKSKGELIIDNYLYLMGIKHVYEKTIRIYGHSLKYDWYLPEINVYIEYWGYFGKSYEKRKAFKLRLYSKAKLRLISIENDMFSDIYKNLHEKLQLYTLKNNDSLNQLYSKYCTNCGEKLDFRYL